MLSSSWAASQAALYHTSSQERTKALHSKDADSGATAAVLILSMGKIRG